MKDCKRTIDIVILIIILLMIVIMLLLIINITILGLKMITLRIVMTRVRITMMTMCFFEPGLFAVVSTWTAMKMEFVKILDRNFLSISECVHHLPANF